MSVGEQEEDQWLEEVSHIEKFAGGPLRIELLKAIIQKDLKAHRSLFAFLQHCGILSCDPKTLTERQRIRLDHVTEWKLTEVFLCLVFLSPEQIESARQELSIDPSVSFTEDNAQKTCEGETAEWKETTHVYLSTKEREDCVAALIRLLQKLPTRAAIQGLYPLLVPTSPEMIGMRWEPNPTSRENDCCSTEFNATGIGVGRNTGLLVKRSFVRALLSSLMVTRADGIRSLVSVLLLDDRVHPTSVAEAAAHLATLVATIPPLIADLDDGTRMCAIVPSDYFAAIGSQFVDLMRYAGSHVPNLLESQSDDACSRLRLFSGIALHQFLRQTSTSSTSFSVRLDCVNKAILGPAFASLKCRRASPCVELLDAIRCVWCVTDAGASSASNCAFPVIWEAASPCILDLCALKDSAYSLQVKAEELCTLSNHCLSRVLSEATGSAIFGSIKHVLFPLLRAATDMLIDGNFSISLINSSNQWDIRVDNNGDSVRLDTDQRITALVRALKAANGTEMVSACSILVTQLLEAERQSSLKSENAQNRKRMIAIVTLFMSLLDEFGPICFVGTTGSSLSITAVLKAIHAFLSLSLPTCLLGCQLVLTLARDPIRAEVLQKASEDGRVSETLAALNELENWLNSSENVERLLCETAIENENVAAVVFSASCACQDMQRILETNSSSCLPPLMLEDESVEKLLEIHLRPRVSDLRHAMQTRQVGQIAISVAELATFVDETVSRGSLDSCRSRKWCGMFFAERANSSLVYGAFQCVVSAVLHCLASYDDPFIVMHGRHIIAWIALHRLDSERCAIISSVLFKALRMPPSSLSLKLGTAGEIRVRDVSIFKCNALEVLLHLADNDAEGLTLRRMEEHSGTLIGELMRVGRDVTEALIVRVAAIHCLGPVVGKLSYPAARCTTILTIVQFVTDIFRCSAPEKCRAAASAMLAHFASSSVDLSTADHIAIQSLSTIAKNLANRRSIQSGLSDDDVVIRMHGDAILKSLTRQRTVLIEELSGGTTLPQHPLQRVILE